MEEAMRHRILCPICHEPKALNEIICDDCRKQMDSECFDSCMFRCPVCRYPLVDGIYSCERCSSQSNVVFPMARYDGKLSYSVLDSFKFHGHKEMADVVASYLNKGIEVLDPLGCAVLVPIPCSTTRLKRFGWDQMTEVCKALGRPYLRMLENVDSERLQQKRMDRRQRLESSQMRFRIKPDLIKRLPDLRRSKIIVVDDIITTMSTMNSAIKLLKEQGIKDVCGVSWLCEL